MNALNRRNRLAMLSDKQCRNLIESDIAISDEELGKVQLLLRQVAEDIFNSFERGNDESRHIYQS